MLCDSIQIPSDPFPWFSSLQCWGMKKTYQNLNHQFPKLMILIPLFCRHQTSSLIFVCFFSTIPFPLLAKDRDDLSFRKEKNSIDWLKRIINILFFLLRKLEVSEVKCGIHSNHSMFRKQKSFFFRGMKCRVFCSFYPNQDVDSLQPKTRQQRRAFTRVISTHFCRRPETNLAAHRQGYRVTTLHMGNGWVTR